MEKCDVLIVGGSKAGGTLARQLKLKHPQLHIVVVEKKTTFKHWVGESMLEIFWDYASKDLQLGHYLDANYFYKHGLRFFFDDERNASPLCEMSEIGRTWYHGIPAHQIDRQKFDTDLMQMNRAIGIECLMGTTVEDVTIDREAGHTIKTSSGNWQCKWLIDAGGMSGPLGKKFNDIRKIDRHPVSTVWGRVRHVPTLDSLGPLAWKERVKFVNRALSTNHFMFGGYWVWLIPLDEQTFSIGVVWHHEQAEVSIRNGDELLAFLRRHAGLRDLLPEQVELLDFSAMKNLARMADTFYSPDRWFRTGMAAAFVDPLFSSGSAFLSDANRMIGDIIADDMAASPHLAEKIAKYDAYSHWWVENFILHIQANYHGSYEIQKILFEALLIDYFGIVFPTSVGYYWKQLAEDHSLSASLLRHKMAQMLEDSAMRRAIEIRDQLRDYLTSHGALRRHNTGEFHDVEICSSHMKNSAMRGSGMTTDKLMQVQGSIFRSLYGNSLALLCRYEQLQPSQQEVDMAIAKLISREWADLQSAISHLKSSLAARHIAGTLAAIEE